MTAVLSFPPFRIDLAGERLWRDDRAIALRPKTWAVLRYLAERPGQLVTKNELFDAVWGDTAVEEKSRSCAVSGSRGGYCFGYALMAPALYQGQSVAARRRWRR